MYIFYVKLLESMMENSYPIQLLYFIMLVAYAHFMLGIYTVKPVYSGHLGEFDKMTTIDR